MSFLKATLWEPKYSMSLASSSTVVHIHLITWQVSLGQYEWRMGDFLTESSDGVKMASMTTIHLLLSDWLRCLKSSKWNFIRQFTVEAEDIVDLVLFYVIVSTCIDEIVYEEGDLLPCQRLIHLNMYVTDQPYGLSVLSMKIPVDSTKWYLLKCKTQGELLQDGQRPWIEPSLQEVIPSSHALWRNGWLGVSCWGSGLLTESYLCDEVRWAQMHCSMWWRWNQVVSRIDNIA